MSDSADLDPGDGDRLLAEAEQLRTSLEAALEDNAALIDQRDRLRAQLKELSRQLKVADALVLQQQKRAEIMEPALAAHDATEEELRVALEELQVMTEELEITNTSLQQTNQQLDARVEERTLQLEGMNAALRATEASLRAVTDLVPELLWRADGEGQADWFNRRWLNYTGQALELLLGDGWQDWVHPQDQVVTRSTWTAAMATGQPFQHEHRIRGAKGEFRWFLVRAEPLRTDDGVIACWYASGTDIHDQRTAMEELRRSEQRFRTLTEGIPQLVWRSDNSGRWTWSSPQWRAYTGQDEAGALGEGWLDAFHPDDRDAARAAWTRAEQHGLLELDGRIIHAAEDRHRHFATRALPVLGARGQVIEWLGTSTDVDDIVALRERQQVLVAELQHRTRNLMGVVRSMSDRTGQASANFPDFRLRFQDRLEALARVQGLLSRLDDTDRVSFDELVHTELAAMEGSLDRVVTEGPSGIKLRSRMVQTLAMALHELATNAVKYGAIGQPDGRLVIAWKMVERDRKGRPRLRIDWRESGVAMPSTGSRAQGSGQGRELIEKALPYQLDAETSFVLGADGVHCTITVPVSASNVKEPAS